MTDTTLVWFQNDLRLRDHPALHAAATRGVVVPVFIDDTSSAETWREGAASKWWRRASLAALEQSLHAVGSRLVLARGDPARVLFDLASQVGATRVHWTRRYEPQWHGLHESVRQSLESGGIEVAIHPGSLLAEPEAVATRAGTPFQVFTPFWRAVLAGRRNPVILTAPKQLEAPDRWPASLAVDDLFPGLAPAWHAKLASHWNPGELSARKALKRFLDEGLAEYAERRDEPGVQGSSRLSPHLHFGEVSAREVYSAVQARAARATSVASSATKYLAELGWREFAHHLLFHFPKSTDAPLRAEFENFPWEDEPVLEAAWQRGLTGIPIVDAGQRELWATGWMHNRVRMISASLLIKNIGVPWLHGAKWFWDTLVDADLANNTLGWQWTAGCGADAAPYFRVFNPVLQGQRYDSAGRYVRRWIPELEAVPDEFVHEPWRSPSPPASYPAPVVDLRASRNAALRAYEEHRSARSR